MASSSSTAVSSNSSGTILAIACGPLVTTWDINNNNSATASLQSPSSKSHDSTIVVGRSIDGGKVAGTGVGVEQFRPHGDCSVVDLAWNHNGQVLATCSDSSSPDQDLPNIALTHSTDTSALLSFSNFQNTIKSNPSAPTDSNSSNSVSKYSDNKYHATSISFCGSSGKSRYLCVSDLGGYISVWDMKKSVKVRYFSLGSDRSKLSTTNSPLKSPASAKSNSNSLHNICSKACTDPTDTYVAGLSGSPTDGSLRLFHLREGKLALTLKDARGGSHGGSNSFQFSNLNKNKVAVGARDGNVLIWDIATAFDKKSSSTSSNNINSIAFGSVINTPISIVSRKHDAAVTDVVFSPTNKALLASSSMDGTIAFHDVNSKKLIQVICPWKHSSGFPKSITHGSGGTILRSNDTNDGVTSLAFHRDGMICAVGTATGFAHVYDLRKASAGPTKTLYLSSVSKHNDNEILNQPVKSLQFAPQVLSNSKTPKYTRKSLDIQPASFAEEKESSSLGELKQRQNVQKMKPISSSPTTVAESASAFSRACDESSKTNGIENDTNTDNIQNASETRQEIETNSALPSPYLTKFTSILPDSSTLVRDLFVGDKLNKSETKTNCDGETKTYAVSEKYVKSTEQQQPLVSARNDTLNNPVVSTEYPQYVHNDDTTDTNTGPIDHNLFSKTSLLVTSSNNNSIDDIPMESIHTSLCGKSTEFKHSPEGKQSSDFVPSTKVLEKLENVYDSDTSKLRLNNDEYTGSDADDEDDKKERNMKFWEKNQTIAINKEELKELLEDTIDVLRDDMEESIRNLHCDCLRQFQRQSDEMCAMFQQQRKLLEKIVEENKNLREENERLRRVF